MKKLLLIMLLSLTATISISQTLKQSLWYEYSMIDKCIKGRLTSPFDSYEFRYYFSSINRHVDIANKELMQLHKQKRCSESTYKQLQDILTTFSQLNSQEDLERRGPAVLVWLALVENKLKRLKSKVT